MIGLLYLYPLMEEIETMGLLLAGKEGFEGVIDILD